jgi:protein-disulfide isomerase
MTYASASDADASCTTTGSLAPIVASGANGPWSLLDSVRVTVPVIGSPMRGPLTARVTIVAFSDFQCPGCQAVSHLLDSVATAFPRDVRIVFKQYPLDIHPHAHEAAEAALAAFEQGRFWEMHDKLFAHSDDIDRSTIMGMACELGLDVTAFSRGLYAGNFRSHVQLDIADGDRLGIRGTPTLFINGRNYLGRRVMSELSPLLRALLEPVPATPATAVEANAATKRAAEVAARRR